MAWFSRWKSADACRLLPTLDAVQTTRYRRFRRLLDHNRTALTLQADLEQVYYDNLPFTFQMVARKGSQLLVEVDGMVQALAGMTLFAREVLPALRPARPILPTVSGAGPR